MIKVKHKGSAILHTCCEARTDASLLAIQVTWS